MFFIQKFWTYHLNVAAEIETHQTRQCFSNLLLSNFGEPVRIVILCFLFLADRSGTRCGLLLLLPICFSFWCVVLSEMVFCHTLVVTSGYLSYCCLFIISNQSAHSPLTSTGIFVHTTAAHWIFSLFWTILCKHLEMVVLENPSRSAVFEIFQTSPSGTNQPFHVQSHLNPLSSPFWCWVWTSASRLHHI